MSPPSPVPPGNSVWALITWILCPCERGRETESIITLEAVFPEAVAAEGETSETLPKEVTLPEVMTAKAAVPEAVPEKASF